MNINLESLKLLFGPNLEVVYFIYGLVFFLMGFAVHFRNSSYSNIKLASSLKYLALFGISHGLTEWATIFIPIQQQLVNHQVFAGLMIFETVFTTTSFLFLFLFGFKLLQETLFKSSIVLVIPWFIYLFWLGSFFLNILDLNGGELKATLINYEIFSRYFLAFPGAIISGYGLFLHSKEFEKLGMQVISKDFFYAACGFLAYAIAAGLIVRKANYLPAILLNKAAFFYTFGFPVQIFRALCGLLISVFIIKGLGVFDFEYRKRLEEAEKSEAIFIERNRICRDLHDGAIQSIYAVGLAMENTLALVRKNPELAERLISQNMKHLDVVIKDIRNYIMELKPTKFDPAKFEESITSLVQQFKVNSLIQCSLSIFPANLKWLEDNQKFEIYHILLESLNNIQKHARASYVTIDILQSNDKLTLVVRDNGIGFDKEAVINTSKTTGFGQGLRNLIARATLCNGTIDIRSDIGKGTEILTVIKRIPGLE